MIAIDTNVVVRLLAQDDPRQSAAAVRVFDGLTPSRPGFLTQAVLVETFWVLHRAYGQPRERVLAALSQLIDADDIRVEDESVVRRAFTAAMDGADFGDALIDASARAHGCETVVSFDAQAQKALDWSAPHR